MIGQFPWLLRQARLPLEVQFHHLPGTIGRSRVAADEQVEDAVGRAGDIGLVGDLELRRHQSCVAHLARRAVVGEEKVEYRGRPQRRLAMEILGIGVLYIVPVLGVSTQRAPQVSLADDGFTLLAEGLRVPQVALARLGIQQDGARHRHEVPPGHPCHCRRRLRTPGRRIRGRDCW